VRLPQEFTDVSKKKPCPETLTVTSEATAKARIDRGDIMIAMVLVATNSKKYETEVDEVRMEEEDDEINLTTCKTRGRETSGS